MILEDYRSQFKQRLEALFPPEEVAAITSIAFEYVLKMSKVGVALSRKQILSSSHQEALNKVLERLLQAEPIAYITGKTQFYGLEVQVNKATLIPRPETEELVNWILTDTIKTASPHILDIGTGSGCIAIALAKNLPRAVVAALDISGAALEIARHNAQANEVNVRFFEQDILETPFLDKKYDLIVSNPPYVRALEKAEIHDNVLLHEPHTALFVTDANPLLFYKKITILAQKALNPKGKLFFEINEYLGEETLALVKELGFSQLSLNKDMFGKDRMIRAIKN